MRTDAIVPVKCLIYLHFDWIDGDDHLTMIMILTTCYFLALALALMCFFCNMFVLKFVLKPCLFLYDLFLLTKFLYFCLKPSQSLKVFYHCKLTYISCKYNNSTSLSVSTVFMRQKKFKRNTNAQNFLFNNFPSVILRNFV